MCQDFEGSVFMLGLQLICASRFPPSLLAAGTRRLGGSGVWRLGSSEAMICIDTSALFLVSSSLFLVSSSELSKKSNFTKRNGCSATLKECNNVSSEEGNRTSSQKIRHLEAIPSKAFGRSSVFLLCLHAVAFAFFGMCLDVLYFSRMCLHVPCRVVMLHKVK